MQYIFWFFFVFLSFLMGCNKNNNGSIQPDKKTPSVTTKPFNFKAKVIHSEAGGSEFTLYQLGSKLKIQGNVDNDGIINAEIPIGTKLDEPIQISVSLVYDTYKYISENVNVIQKVNDNLRRSTSNEQISLNERTIGNDVNHIVSLQSTVEFALYDKDHNGFLSKEEILNKNENLLNLDSIKDLMIAVDVASNNPSQLYYNNTYEMISNFIDDYEEENSFFILNSELINESKLKLFNESNTLNNELKSFLKLDNNASLLSELNSDYDESEWKCLDDIRHVKRGEKYGERLWLHDTFKIQKNEINNLINSINESNTCNSRLWKLPTVNELNSLYINSEFKFPNSFPNIDLHSSFWALDNGDKVLVSFLPEFKLINESESNRKGIVLLNSFKKVDMWVNEPPIDTPFNIKELRELYSKPTSEWPRPTLSKNVDWQELGLLPDVPFPNENPYSREKVDLGRKLFFDKKLSKDNTISCSSCHEPKKAWTDGLATSVGIKGQKGNRNTPTIINTAYYDTLFLDGRVNSLEEQSLHPIENPIEMGLSINELLSKLNNDSNYRSLFKGAFGDKIVTEDRIAKSIATFERTIISHNSKFDQFLKGDNNALSDEQIHGLHLYRTKARCMNCHSGPLFTNNKFENIGLTYYNRNLEDRGRYNVTFNNNDMGKFRVPSLREIKSTSPYTHLGLFELAENIPHTDKIYGLLSMYNNGMTRNREGNFPQYEYKYDKKFPVVSPLIERLHLTNKELRALDAFLLSLSSDIPLDSASPSDMGIKNI